MGFPVGPITWDLAGQLVAMVFAALATGLAWWYAAKAFDARIATLGILLFTVTREWTTVGADALSDTMAVAFQMFALVLGVAAERRLSVQPVQGAALAGAAGLTAGCAYLVRPEGGLVLIAVMTLMLASPLRHRSRWWAAGVAAAAAVVGLGVAGAPYALYVGTVTPRHDLFDFLWGLRASSGTWPMAMIPVRQTTAYVVMEEFVGGLHATTAVLIVLWAVTWVASRVARLRLPRRVCVFPTSEASIVTIAMLLMYLSMLTARHVRWGRVSSRYFMLPSLLLAPLAGAAVWILSQWWRLLSRRFGRHGARVAGSYWILVVGILVALTIHAARPLHKKFECARSAGEYIRRVSGPEDRVLTNDHRAIRYAERPGRTVHTKFFFRADALARIYGQSDYSYVAVSTTPDLNALLSDRFRSEFNLRLLRSFPSSDPERVTSVYGPEAGVRRNNVPP